MSKEINEVYFFDPAYNVNNYETEWLNVNTLKVVRFSSYCNQTYDKGIKWAIDRNYNIINEDTHVGIINYNYSEYPVKAQYAKLYIRNIGALPCSITLQGFYNN